MDFFSSFTYFSNIPCLVNLKVSGLKAYTVIQALPLPDTFNHIIFIF